MLNFRSFSFVFITLKCLTLASTDTLADDRKKDIETNTIESIRIVGQRNELGSNRLVSNNITYTHADYQSPIKPTIANWLTHVPGVNLNGQGGLLQSYSIRGFSRWRVLTQVDGVPIYTDRRAGNSASFIPGSLLSGFDVQKGPSSALYGSEAIGGVVNLHSVNFSENYIAFSGQSNDQAKAITAAYGDEQWQSAVSFRHANNAKNGNNEPLNTGLEQLTLVNKARVQIDALEAKITWIPSIGKDIGKSAATYPQERITQYPNDIHSIFLAELTDNQFWYAKAYHHYQNWDSDVTRVGKRRNLTEYQGHTLGASVLGMQRVFSGEMRLGVDWINRQGVSIKEQEYDNSDQFIFSKQLIDGQQHNAAIFSDIHWQFEQYSVSTGLRYDYISQRQFIQGEHRTSGALNGSVLLKYHPSTRWSLQAELASGFRFPTLTELYFDGQTPRGTTQGNPNLKPEESMGLQLFATYTVTEDLTLDLSTYYYQMDNYIERYSVDDTTLSYRNLFEAEISGVETTLNWSPSSRWLHMLSFQWQQGEDKQNQTLSDLQAPQWRWNMHWFYDSFTVKNELSYRAKKTKYSAEEQALQSLLTWNVSLTTALSSSTHITLWANNLLDRVAPTSADEDAPDIIGRNLGIKFSYHF